MPKHDQQQPDALADDAAFDADLHPNFLAGQNHGLAGGHAQDEVRTAADIKELHGQLAAFSNDELKAISILYPGTRLEQGAVYLDLRHLQQGPFTATAQMSAEAHAYIVPKKLVDYVIWNRLTGVTEPARLDQQDDQS